MMVFLFFLYLSPNSHMYIYLKEKDIFIYKLIFINFCSVCVCVPIDNLLSLYNIISVYVFWADHLVSEPTSVHFWEDYFSPS